MLRKEAKEEDLEPMAEEAEGEGLGGIGVEEINEGETVVVLMVLVMG